LVPGGPPDEAAVEAAVLRALATGSFARLKAAGEDAHDLGPARRAKLPLRVRPDGVEFRFRGDYPGGSPFQMLEYLASVPEKDYESMLVLTPAEMERLKKLGQALADLKKAGRRAELQYKLVWAEGDRARVEDVRDMLAGLGEDGAQAFFDQLG